jgi:uncharacterized SAM-binding protein YcdF (DUF218 family)
MHALKYAEWTLPVLLLMLGLGIWRLRRHKSPAFRFLFGCWLALCLLSWTPFTTLIIGTLEWQAPVRPASNPGVQVMVVLSGGWQATNPPEPAFALSFDTEVRCRHAAWLYRNGWQVPVLVSGVGEAPLMRESLIGKGIPAQEVGTEAAATSTYDSAQLAARILQPRGIRKILLVTEAYHMPRALRLFRHAGFDVVASPCVYRTQDFRGGWEDWLLLKAKAIEMFELALHEWLGLGWSWASGRI